MKFPFRLRLGLALCAGLMMIGFSGAARAQSAGGPFEITKSVAAGGGGRSQSTNLALEGTVGQPAAGPVGGGTYTLAGGFHTPEAQAGCQFALSPNAGTAPAAGGSVVFTVVTDPGCTWSATSTLGWATVASGATGNGTGAVTLTVQPNTGPPRGGTVMAAGLVFNLKQAGIVNDSVALSVTSISVQPATCATDGYAGDVLLTATLTNTGAVPLSNLAFQVLELREAAPPAPSSPFRLISANGATCASGGLVGDFQDVPGTLASGASTTVIFRIAAPVMTRLRFLVSATATREMEN